MPDNPAVRERLVAADTTSCLDEGSCTEVNLGDLWAAFTDNVSALIPIATFVLLFGLAVVVLGRLLALVPGFRNVRSLPPLRTFAWTAGLILAFVSPALIALRGMWIMAQGGPTGESVTADDFTFGQFLQAVVWRSWNWWLLLLLVLIAVATLTFAFATRQGVTIQLVSKEGGKGLDTAHVMATMDGMAGQTNRGLEFPVGTDLTKAAGAVSELSENKFVRTLQVAVSAILGSTPWQMTVENENEKGASVTISRNGALIKAKRVKIGGDLSSVTERTSAELLAAYIAGELIAALRSRYPSEYDAHLSGATDGESIALHYIASSALADTRATRAKGISILARAVELDPQNRAAWTTLANFAYRDPMAHDSMHRRAHVQYREFLDRAILDELKRGRNWWDRRPRRQRLTLMRLPQTKLAPDAALDHLEALKEAIEGIHLQRMRRNGLLVRLLQTRVVAAMNAKAAGDNPPHRTPGQDKLDDEYLSLRRKTYGGPPSKGEPPTTTVRRRQLLLVDEFRAEQTAMAAHTDYDRSSTIDRSARQPPSVLSELDAFEGELEAWNAVAARADWNDPIRARIECEDAALEVSGDFAHDPIVAYSVACYRAVLWAAIHKEVPRVLHSD